MSLAGSTKTHCYPATSGNKSILSHKHTQSCNLLKSSQGRKKEIITYYLHSSAFPNPENEDHNNNVLEN